MLRITVVTETYRPEVNGVANTLGYWVDGFKKRGIHVQIIRPKQHSKDLELSSDTEHQITVTGLPIPNYPELKFGLPCRKKLSKLWKTNQPDAVYVATEGPLGLSAIKAANALGIPVVSGFHTNFQHYSRFYKLAWLENIIVRYLRYVHNLANATLVPTAKQQKLLSTYAIKDIQIVSRGVDCERFNPLHRDASLRRQWGATDEQTVYLYVGRLAAEKNVTLIGELSNRLEMIDSKAKVICVGDGPLKKTMQQNYPNIIYPGMKTGQELSTYYASADIFLFPSLTDTFGNVVTEAMASELAIVSFDDAAAQEHLVHDQSALLAPIPDKETFLTLAVNLGADNNRITLLRRNARLAAQAISWNEIVDQLLTILLKSKYPPIRSKQEDQANDNAKRLYMAR